MTSEGKSFTVAFIIVLTLVACVISIIWVPLMMSLEERYTRGLMSMEKSNDEFVIRLDKESDLTLKRHKELLEDYQSHRHIGIYGIVE